MTQSKIANQKNTISVKGASVNFSADFTLPLAGYKLIPLTQGQFAIVDDKDYDWLNQHKWFAHKNGNTYYAARKIRTPNRQKQIYMHREIMNALSGLEIDHINGNGLDNRKINLRICIPSENMANKRKYKNSKSQYKGIYKDKNRWRASIKEKGKTINLGSYRIEIEAAKNYDKKAKELFGEFARTNF